MAGRKQDKKKGKAKANNGITQQKKDPVFNGGQESQIKSLKPKLTSCEITPVEENAKQVSVTYFVTS